MAESVILVDEHDQPIGEREKLAAHQSGELHRAFSVFLFDRNGRWLLQKRHPAKYHSGGLWTNTCCSHPAPGERTEDAARKRLVEEMGIDAVIAPIFEFRYYARFENNLIEHELDHVFVGGYDGVPEPDPTEVIDWRWVSTGKLAWELEQDPNRFTYWFREAEGRVLQYRTTHSIA